MTGRIPIEQVSPVVDCGRHPAKAVVGERLEIAATVYREGHDALGANVCWRDPDGRKQPFARMRAVGAGRDRWATQVVADRLGRWTFSVEAWADPYATWHHNVQAKLDAGQGIEDLHNDLEEGAQVLIRALRAVPKDRRPEVTSA